MQQQQQQSPLYSFMYALKSSEARRQYPKRLKMLFDYLKLAGPLEEQAIEFLDISRQEGAQCRRCPSKSGSLYLHCDWHASHYLKLELDKIFGYNKFVMKLFGKDIMHTMMADKDLDFSAEYMTLFYSILNPINTHGIPFISRRIHINI